MTDEEKKDGYEVSITEKVFVSDRDLLEQKYVELVKENAELKAQSEITKVYLAKIFENGWMSDFLVFGTLEKAESFKKEHEKSTPIDIRIKIEQYLVR